MGKRGRRNAMHMCYQRGKETAFQPGLSKQTFR